MSQPEDRKPTPVRMAMEGNGADDSATRTRLLRQPGSEAEWSVSVVGRSGCGILPLRTVPLMELEFAPSSPNGGTIRRVLCLARDLEDLTEEELATLLERASPPRPPASGQEGRAGSPLSRRGRRRNSR